MTPELAPLAWAFLAMGAAGLAWLAGLAARRWWERGGEDLGRVQRLGDADNAARVPVTDQPPLADLVVSPELERYAARQAGMLRQAPGGTAVCTRCARGDPQLSCACGNDCYEAECLGGLQ